MLYGNKYWLVFYFWIAMSDAFGQGKKSGKSGKSWGKIFHELAGQSI